MKNYLTEPTLGNVLTEVFNCDFIHDKIVLNSGSRKRPDYHNHKLKLIVEFDGYHHYTMSSYVLGDEEKDRIFSKMGFKIVRIPYFVQINTNVLKYLFDIDYEYNQIYPHGFIDPKATNPSDFCELGIEKFKNDLERFLFLKEDIITSLRKRIAQLGDERLVIPKSLKYLL